MKRRRTAPLEAKSRLWLERDGVPVYGDGKHEWLEMIAETGSLRATAEELGMSYRGLWGRIREMEKRLGVPLVTRHRGGSEGGGTELTPEAQALAAAYGRFRAGLDALLARRSEALKTLDRATRPTGRHRRAKRPR